MDQCTLGSSSGGNAQLTSTPRHDGPTLEDVAAGELAGRTAPNNKTAGGARELAAAWVEELERLNRKYAELLKPRP